MGLTRRLFVAAMLFSASFLLNPRPSVAVTPAGQLQETWTQIVLVLKSARFDSKEEIDSFRIKIMAAVSPRFDFAEMAKRSLGSHWAQRSREEKTEFINLLANTLARTYITGIRSHEDATVVYLRESNDSGNAEVATKIVANGAKDLAVLYKMHLVETDWKIYDVVIDDISLTENYRSQFHRVITQSSFEDLLRIMKEKQRS